MTKISIATMDSIAKENYVDTITTDFYGKELVIKRNISLGDMIKFVRDVTNGCFADGTGEYIPEVKKFFIKNAIVEYYSNVSLPENIKHKYELLYKTGVADVILDEIDQTQYEEIIEAIDEKIDARVYTNEQMFDERVKGAVQSVDNLVRNVKEIFSGMTNEDMQKLLSAISNNTLDEEKLVNAYMNSKYKSDEQEEKENIIDFSSIKDRDDKN